MLRSTFSRPIAATSLVVFALVSCVATPEERSASPNPSGTDSVQGATQEDLPTFYGDLLWSPIKGWKTCPRIDFENMLAFQLAAPPASLTEDSLASLSSMTAAWLEQTASEPGHAELQMRAVLILAACRTPDADGMLLDLLSARTPIPTRHADAAMVVAAAHLALSTVSTAPATLTALACGSNPHPDLEVRTECARSALGHSRTEVIPTLLSITRLGTPLGLARDGDWHTAQLTTWSRNRAAEALAEYAGIPCPYRGDGSIEQREAASLALEAALLDRGRLLP